MSCIVKTSFDKKPSITHKKLLDYFGNTPNGQIKADAEFLRLSSETFINKFHGANETPWTLGEMQSGFDRTRFTRQKEPALQEDKSGKLYYINHDGSRQYVKGLPLKWFSNKAKKQFIDNILFSAIGNEVDLISLDFEDGVGFMINEVLEDLKPWITDQGGTDVDMQYIREELIKTINARKLSIKDAQDINKDSYTEVDENLDEDNVAEVEEVREGNDVVRQEAMFKNSKDTASANIKMMLSFVPNIQSFTINETTREPEVEYVENELSQEAGETFASFRDPHEIWRKLEEGLSDIFTQLDSEGNVVSVLSQMSAKLDSMAQRDASIAYVKYYLDQFNDDKKIQFAQAFMKHQIVFSNTEVAGDETMFSYKVIDPVTSVSKSFKIRQTWNEALGEAGLLKKKVSDRGVVSYNVVPQIQQDLILLTKQAAILAGKNKASFADLSQDIQTLETALQKLGIPTGLLTEDNYQAMLHEMQLQKGKSISPNKFLKTLFDEAIVATRVLSTTPSAKFVKSGKFINPIITSDIYKRISNSLAVTSDLVGESTVFIAGGKTAWTYSLPTYLDITMSKIKNGIYETKDSNGNTITRNRYAEELEQSSPYYRNHPWIKQLHDRSFVNQLSVSVFSGFNKRGASKYGKDNKNILFADQLSDKIYKSLLPRVEPNSKSIFYSPAAADKGRLNQLMGFGLFNVDITLENGIPSVAFDGLSAGNVIDVIIDSVEAEYLRSKEAYTIAKKEGESIDNMHIHYNLKMVNGVFSPVNAEGIPVGNAIQLQTMPELSPYTLTGKDSANMEFGDIGRPTKLMKVLYAYNGNDVEYLLESFDTEVNRTTVREMMRQHVARKLDERIKQTVKTLEDNNVVGADEKGKKKNFKLDSTLWKSYNDKYKMLDNETAYNTTLYELAADFVANGVISNLGYTKLFAGDVAYYKDTVDFNKRIPATYTDGKYLMIDKKADVNFNAAVIYGVEIAAKNLDQLESNFVDSIKEQVKYMTEEQKDIYTGAYIKALAKGYASQYNSVNTTDAQAWISLDRWKFLKQKLGEWSPKAEESFKRMKDGTSTYEDLKFAAQPLKGVYFNQNSQTGVPTYLKYSQAVLIPSMVKGTQLEYISEAMKKSKVDEVITLDGVKVGAISPTKVHDDQGNINADLTLNPYKLSNLHWKLQQQLPVKGMKNNMDVGSQLQKNIVSNIFPAGQYGRRTGEQVINDMNKIVSDLTLSAFNQTIKDLGLNENGKVTNKARFYDRLSKLALDKGVPAFAVEALNREYEIDAIPQLRYKIQNIISAAFNNNIAKNQTPGGSFIQISNIGVTQQDIDNPKETGIYMLKDTMELERPKLNIAEGKVSSGQIFLPHSFIAKYVPNYRDLSREELLKKVDKELFKVLGYRIPNQKLSSNQPLEVVGILPVSMGDSVMMYTEITTQTGSDFDIDKTYMMLPAFEVEYSNKEDLVKEVGKMSVSDLMELVVDQDDYSTYLRENIGDRDITSENTIQDILQEYTIDKGLIPANMTQKYVTGVRYVKPSMEEKSSKKQLQNELFELYYDVLTSPLSYVDMMSGIDGAELKNEINRLHGKREALTSLQLMDPTYQLQVKFDNIVGKSGVGLTANQMVDHVYGQITGMSMISPVAGMLDTDIHVNEDGTVDLSQIFDTDGNKILDSVSMFLNAYVDIAKDPYITKGNFNVHTSNATFFLLRSGMPLKKVISFIGQPVLKKAIALYESTLSSLPSTVNKKSTLDSSLEKAIKPLMERSGIALNNLRNNDTTRELADLLESELSEDLGVASKANLDETIMNEDFYEALLDALQSPLTNQAELDNIIKFADDNNTSIEEIITDLGTYIATKTSAVTAYANIHKAGEQLAEQVLASKADVNGGGHDIVHHFVNNNKFNKVISEGTFPQFADKFKEDSMLGAKTLYTMRYMSSLDENLFITMDPMIKSVYPMISRILKGDEFATNADVVKRIESSMYGSLVHMALENSPYQIDGKSLKTLFRPGDDIIARINNAKLNPKFNENKLIQSLESVVENEVGSEGNLVESFTFLSVDNFIRKPGSLYEDLEQAWQELLESEDVLDRELGIDLIKYAIATSGLAKSRHSIFEFMPVDVADYLHRGITKMRDQGLPTVFNKFLENFLRHRQNADFRINVPLQEITAGVNGVTSTQLGLDGISKSITFVKKGFTEEQVTKLGASKVQAAVQAQQKLENYKFFRSGKNSQLMEYIGIIKSDDGLSDIMVIAPTYSLGKAVGNGNIYEYNTENDSVFASNKHKDLGKIKEGIDRIREEFFFEDHGFNMSTTLQFYGSNIEVSDYDGAKVKAKLMKMGLIKENKC